MTATTHRLLIAVAASIAAHAALALLPRAGIGQGMGVDSEVSARQARGFQIRIADARDAQTSFPPAESSPASAAASYPDSSEANTAEAIPSAVQGNSLLPLTGPTYYSAEQLSKRPVLIGDDPLDSVQLRLLASSGKLMLRLWIDDNGQVVQAEAEKNELPPDFAAATAAAFRQVRFSPGEREGMRVGSIIKIEVRYSDARRSS